MILSFVAKINKYHLISLDKDIFMKVIEIISIIFEWIVVLGLVIGMPFLCYRSFKSSRELKAASLDLMKTVKRSVRYRNTNYGEYRRHESMTEGNYIKHELAMKKWKKSKSLFRVGIISGLLSILFLWAFVRAIMESL